MKDKYCLLDNINFIYSRKLVLYIFAKEVTFIKVATYRLGFCNLVRKGMTKKFRKKNCKILRITILDSPCVKTLMAVSFLRNRFRIDSRHTTLLEKNFLQAGAERSMLAAHKDF